MQVDKPKKNRFRKLVPTSTIHHDSASLLYEEGSNQTYRFKEGKKNYSSFGRESSQQLKILRHRQVMQRRLKTISSLQERQEQNREKHTRVKSQFSDHKLKISKEAVMQVRKEKEEREKLRKMVDLIVQFQRRTERIKCMELADFQQGQQGNKSNISQQSDLEEQTQNLNRESQTSSVRLLEIYLGRVVKCILSRGFYMLQEYEDESGEQYLSSSIKPFCPASSGKGRNGVGRSGLLDVHKFFDSR